MSWFNPDKKFGLVVLDDGRGDAFLHMFAVKAAVSVPLEGQKAATGHVIPHTGRVSVFNFSDRPHACVFTVALRPGFQILAEAEPEVYRQRDLPPAANCGRVVGVMTSVVLAQAALRPADASTGAA